MQENEDIEQLKTNIDDIKKSAVINKIDCYTNYMGETGQKLNIDLQEHQRKIKPPNLDAHAVVPLPLRDTFSSLELRPLQNLNHCPMQYTQIDDEKDKLSCNMTFIVV